MQPLPIPFRRWETRSVDFNMGLPESEACKFNMIMVPGSIRVCACVAKQRCSLGVGTISGEGLLSVGVDVGTHALGTKP